MKWKHKDPFFLIYNKEDIETVAKRCLRYIDTIVIPFWEKTSDIVFLFEQTYSTALSGGNLLQQNETTNMLNILALAVLKGNRLPEFRKIVAHCKCHSVFECKICNNKHDKLVNHIIQQYYNGQTKAEYNSH